MSDQTSASPSSGNKGNLFIFFILCTVIVCAYFGVFFSEFISDDWPMIANNPHLQSVTSVPSYFTSGVWEVSQLNVQEKNLYRPLYLLWYFVLFTLFGPSPFWFHLSLLLVHALNVFMVFRLLQIVYDEPGVKLPAACALLFAVHPALTQDVAWISGGTDVVMTVFFLASFLSYLKSRDQWGGWWYFLSAGLFAAALLVKETAVVLPFLIAACELFRGERPSRLVNRFNGGFLAILGAYLLLRTSIIDLPPLTFSPENLFRLLEQFVLTLRFMFIPWPQQFYFSYPPGGIAGSLDIALGIIFLAVLAGLYARGRGSWFGLVWMGLTVLPSLTVALHTHGVFALRFLYLPVIGLSFFLFPCLRVLLKKGSTVLTGILLSVMVLMVIGTAYAVGDWLNEGRFYKKVILADPGSESGYIGMATYYDRNGDKKRSIEYYDRGLANVTEKKGRVELLRLLARKYADSGLFGECAVTFEMAGQLSPESKYFVGAGNCYWMLKEYDSAGARYTKAIQVNPKDSLALANYAQMSAAIGKHDAALKYYRQILQLPVNDVDPAALARARAYLSKRNRLIRQ